MIGQCFIWTAEANSQLERVISCAMSYAIEANVISCIGTALRKNDLIIKLSAQVLEFFTRPN
jgi:hypothetical protein